MKNPGLPQSLPATAGFLHPAGASNLFHCEIWLLATDQA
jgi:hypothetical protein